MAASAEELAGVAGHRPEDRRVDRHVVRARVATGRSSRSCARAGVDFGVAPAVEADVPQVLEGKAVVVSGTLAGYTRDEATAAIVARGGTSPGSVSAKTYALVVGDNPGASKVTKAEQVERADPRRGRASSASSRPASC